MPFFSCGKNCSNCTVKFFNLIFLKTFRIKSLSVEFAKTDRHKRKTLNL